MPRSLIKYAVHPAYPVANPPQTSKWRSYITVIVGIVVVILFCDSLFHYNDPHSSNQISPYIPVQLQPNPMLQQKQNINQHALYRYNQDESDSLEKLLRPIRSSDIIEIEPLNSKNIENDEKQEVESIDSKDIKQMVQEHDNKKLLKLMQQTKHNGHEHHFQIQEKSKPKIQKKDDIKDEIIDYWDFPKSSHSEPTETSSARHRGEYAMHIARVKWFKDNFIAKNKQLAPSSNLIENFKTRCPVYKTTKYCKWTPSKEDLCNWTNTAIFWHSMHGTMIGRDFRTSKPGKHWIWDFAKELKESSTCSCPQNVAFVFADNQQKEEGMRLSERSYKYCNDNCHFYHVAKDYNPWDWFGKIGPLLDLIDDTIFQSKYEYVILTDADDQTLVKSPIDIIDAFEFYNASIVVGGEATSYPNWQSKEKGFESAVYPWSRHHQHLNAGGFMGKIKNMIPYLKYMKDDYNNFTINRADEIKERGRNFWRDQTVWRQMHHKFYPDIKIDSLAKLWARTDVFMYDL